jgi:RNA polymerase sigma factor (sigma-70 family)
LEGITLSNPPYIIQEYEHFFVAESSLPENIEQRRPLEWAEDEIAAIRRVLRKLAVLRIINFDDVDDLVQDTLLTMIAKPPASELEKGLLVWSLGILRNKVGNYYRKSQRYKPLVKIEDLTESSPYSLSSSPEAKASDTELRTLINEKIAELPPCQKEVMELLVSGHDPSEIVTKLHPERYQNVINRLHRGRKKLAKELARYGYRPGSLTRMKCARGRKSSR